MASLCLNTLPSSSLHQGKANTLLGVASSSFYNFSPLQWTVYWCPPLHPNSHGEILIPSAMESGGGAFRILGDKVSDLRSEVRVLIKETLESWLPPSTLSGHSEHLAVCNWKRTSPESDHVGILPWTSSLKNWNEKLISVPDKAPVCGICDSSLNGLTLR